MLFHKGTVGLGGHLTVCDITYNFVGDVTDERYREYEPDGNAYTKVLDAHIEKKYELPHTKLLSSYVITIESGGVTDAETVMCPDYDDFGNVIGIDRGGTAADMTYGYDLLHGWIKEISSTGGFEQKLYWVKANLELLNSIQKIEYFFSGHPIDIKIVDPKEIEEEYE